MCNQKQNDWVDEGIQSEIPTGVVAARILRLIRRVG